MFSAKELEQYAKQFEGFIQNCFNARITALNVVEQDEEDDPMHKAMGNNVRF